MNEAKQTLIRDAIRQYKKIEPCTIAKTFDDCFTIEEGMLFFWFNTADNSTHVVAKELD